MCRNGIFCLSVCMKITVCCSWNSFSPNYYSEFCQRLIISTTYNLPTIIMTNKYQESCGRSVCCCMLLFYFIQLCSITESKIIKYRNEFGTFQLCRHLSNVICLIFYHKLNKFVECCIINKMFFIEEE